jgi:uncharacterized repeat protein (TIGR04052 family)
VIQRLAILLLPTQLLTACSDSPLELSIPFVPVFGEQVLVCDAIGDAVALSDLRLYIANVQLVSEAGELVDVQLEADGEWQQPDLALLDFENGSGECANGSTATNTTLRGKLPNGAYRGLQFTVGVPFDRNHADPLQAVAPLDDPAMHWHWRAGYKFLRAAIRTADDGFWIHLGSTGCEGTIRNISSCRSPNRVAVMLADFVPGRNTVAIDLAALLANAALDDAVASDCSSGPAEVSCAAPFHALGLDFAGVEATQGQRLFRVENSN